MKTATHTSKITQEFNNLYNTNALAREALKHRDCKCFCKTSADLSGCWYIKYHIKTASLQACSQRSVQQQSTPAALTSKGNFTAYDMAADSVAVDVTLGCAL